MRKMIIAAGAALALEQAAKASPHQPKKTPPDTIPVARADLLALVSIVQRLAAAAGKRGLESEAIELYTKLERYLNAKS